jgi:hypothetical protein
MRPFRYLRDPLFLTGCAAYAVNRWIFKGQTPSGFLHSYFNDLWLMPCALPPVLWVHRLCGWRSHDEPPRFSEIFSHLVFWSLLFEWLGPLLAARATADVLDVIAYAAGAIAAWGWWRRDRLRMAVERR